MINISVKKKINLRIFIYEDYIYLIYSLTISIVNFRLKR